MKRIIVLTWVLLTFSCRPSLLDHPIIITNENNISKIKIILTRYNKSARSYSGKAIVKNLTEKKAFYINRFIIKNKTASYDANIPVVDTPYFLGAPGSDCKPQKACQMDIVIMHIPQDADLTEVEIEMNALIENALDPKTLREMK